MTRFFNVKTVSITLLTILWVIFAFQFGILIVQFHHSTHEYSAFLTNRFLWSCGGMFTFFTIFILAGILIYKKIDSKCIENWMIIVWTVYIIVGLSWLQYQFQNYNKDIKNGDYVVYSGEFEKDTVRGFLFLTDETSTRIYNTNETFLEPGKYSGKIVYSRRTKYVLSYILDSGENSSVT